MNKYKTLYGLLLKPKQVGKGQEREKIKIIILINSHPTRTREFEKNSKKISKKLKNTIMPSFQAKTSRERTRNRVNKNYRSDQFLHDS